MINNISIKFKYICINLTIVAIIMLGVIISIGKLIGNYNELIYKMTFDNLSLMMEKVERELENVEQLSKYIVTDTIIQSTLSDYMQVNYHIKSQLRARIKEQLYAYLNSKPYIEAVYIYNDEMMIRTNTEKDLSIRLQEEAKIQAEKARGAGVWLTTLGTSKENVLCSRQIREIESLSLKNLGTLVIEVNFKEIMRTTLGKNSIYDEESKSEIYVYSADEIIYSENNSLKYSGKFKEFKKAKKTFYEIISIDGESYYLIKKNMAETNWTYISLTPYRSIYKGIINTHFIVINIIVVFVMIAIWLGISFARYINKQFNVLIYEMQAFKGEEFNISYEMHEYIDRKDEIGEIYRHFIRMALNITDLINLNLKKEIMLKDTELRILMQQINPHFLYNTLNTLNWMAQIRGEKDISKGIIALSSILRITIDPQSKLISIKKELDIINQYILLQKMRYQERLEFFVDIHEELLDKEIPKLCIQALIENSINHVLEETDGICKISLQSQINKEYIVIKVADNGKGIEQDILKQLEENKIQAKNTGIGLINIQKRLQHHFGEGYGLKFTRDETGGIVHIEIPR